MVRSPMLKRERTAAIRHIILTKGPITSAGIREALLETYGTKHHLSDMTSREICKHVHNHLGGSGVKGRRVGSYMRYYFGGWPKNAYL